MKSFMKCSAAVAIAIFAQPNNVTASPLTKPPITSQVDYQTQEDLVRMTAAAMHAWNPLVDAHTIELTLKDHVKSVGIQVGLLTPLLAMVDISYIANRPNFAHALGPIIQILAPAIGRELTNSLNIPSRYTNPFSEVANSPTNELEAGFKNALGQWEPDRDLNWASSSASPNQLIDQMLIGPGSLFHHIQKERNAKRSKEPSSATFGNSSPSSGKVPEDTTTEGKHFDPTRGGINSTPGYKQDLAEDKHSGPPKRRGFENEPNRGTPNIDHDGDRQPKGPLSNRDLTSYNTCLATCADSAGKLGSAFGILGAKLGGYLTPTLGPLAPVTGGALGGAIGVAIGGYDCSKSAPCQGKKEKDSTPEPQKTPKEPKEPKQPSEPKEPNRPKEPTEPIPDNDGEKDKEPKPTVPSPSTDAPKKKDEEKPSKDDETPNKEEKKDELSDLKIIDIDRLMNRGITTTDPRNRDHKINPIPSNFGN